MGEHLVDQDNKLLYVCLNAKNRTTQYTEAIDMNGIYCRETCPVEGFATCEKENFYRKFDDTGLRSEQWNSFTAPLVRTPGSGQRGWTKRAPREGDDVIIPCEWTMFLNVNEWTFGTLYLDGTLMFDPTISTTTVTATNIWVRSGGLVAGNSEQPFS